MAGYKKIQGNPIKPMGSKPSGNYGNQVLHNVKPGVHVKGSPSSHKSIGGGKESFMGKGASGHVSIRGGAHA